MRDISIEYEGTLGYGYLEITDKLDECRFFLQLMERTTDWHQFRWLTSAFLNAARAAMDWLALSAFYAIPGDEQFEMEADEGAISTLSEYLVMKQEIKTGKVYASPRHPLLKKLCEHRRVTAHEGPLWIKPEKVADSRDFRFWWDDTVVLKFAAEVLDLLSSIQSKVRSD